MSDTVISVENVSKIYRLGEVGTGSLAHDVNRWWHRIRGKEDPYLKVGQVNDRTQATKDPNSKKKPTEDWVYALKEISFELKRGEVLGIIGRNGAGKSTLLKILSRVTTQTSGHIKAKGRIASLLEVGTGFHPELTGRENIFLNGAILGMRRAETASKFDEIVEFSGCARYIDTPVKRYSSGMYVRLAFAVAAHLETDILIVDEVLAVGDAEFQRKCIGKMKDISHNGRTVIFVSHNIPLISSLCKKSLLLANGQVEDHGNTTDLIKRHLGLNSTTENKLGFSGKFKSDQIIIRETYTTQNENRCGVFESHSPIRFGIEIEVLCEFEGLIVQARLSANDERRLVLTNFDDSENQTQIPLGPGIYRFEALVPGNFLAFGNYKISFWVGIHNRKSIAEDFGPCHFTVENTSGIGRRYYVEGDHKDVIRPNWLWNVTPVTNKNPTTKIKN